MKTRYCSQCGSKVETQEGGMGKQQVCNACGTVAYSNPLPVAACVVLNEKREVLLVKRRNEPHQGQWCLPTGFAESGESIGDAALRELREETGLEGQIHKLLSVGSQESDFYGDLLFVSFEIDIIGGREQSGDDAQELSHFPLDRVPRLAFPAHEEAILICAELNRDEWAIQDSFARLHTAPTEELLSDALVSLVMDQAAEITRSWFELVLENPSTPTYKEADPGLIKNKANAALTQFTTWLRDDVTSEEIVEFYKAVGRERHVQGFALHELVSALMLLRKEIWRFIREQHALERLLDVYRVMELSRRIALFFDKALYNIVRGFEEA